MTTKTSSDTAAQAAINAAARELHLPTVRTEAERLAEIAERERQTHRGYLAEVLAAEVDDRTERRRTRRINEAKFPADQTAGRVQHRRGPIDRARHPGTPRCRELPRQRGARGHARRLRNRQDPL